ncbi:MAG: hypothetical protein KatS3mg108_2798 [Isosphaeraceae bacterium]|jgi:uncharacterized protein (DUF362 family)|nr:MAG: hypothetical protein KatS3mg108_2798 [Isosphaeraceae bacterium]
MSEKLTRTQLKNLERLGGVNPADAPFSRRQFVTQVGGFAAAAGAAVAGGLYLRDRWGMVGVEPPPPVTLRSFAVERDPSKPTLAIVRRRDPGAEATGSAVDDDPAFRMIKAGIDALGGIERFIKRDDVVVVKPNVAFDKNPDLAATTQPDAVEAVIRLCRAAGARRVIVCDNPINNPESCFFKTKVGDAALRAGAELMLPKESYFEPLYIGGETITQTWKMFHRPFKEATKVIGIAPVKDHNLCKATVTMKNWYGLLGNPRNQFHQDIHGIISDFALMIQPTLVIADGRKLLMQHGPTGGSLNDVKVGDTVVVGTDHVAVDSWCVSRLLEKPRGEIVYLDKALVKTAARNIAAADWRPQWTVEVTA